MTFLGALYIGLKQNEINQNLLDLNYSVSVEVAYVDKQVQIHNKGQTNILLWGNKIGDRQKRLEAEPRYIVPGGFYYILADQWESGLVKTLAQNLESRIPFEVYVESENKRKYIVKGIFFVKIIKGGLEIHSQTLAVAKSEWVK